MSQFTNPSEWLGSEVEVGLEEMNGSKAYPVWSTAEHQTLRDLIAEHGDSRRPSSGWKNIAKGIPDRTAKDCLKPWFHSLDPSLRRDGWTEHEDCILFEAYNKLGPVWRDISLLILGRRDYQCFKRYNDILVSLAKNQHRDWTEDEDNILRNSVKQLGHRWSAISTRLTSRSPLTCRTRWRQLLKRVARSSEANSACLIFYSSTPEATQKDIDALRPQHQMDTTSTSERDSADGLYNTHSPRQGPLDIFLQSQEMAQIGFLEELMPPVEGTFDAIDRARTELHSTEPPILLPACNVSKTFAKNTTAASLPVQSYSITPEFMPGTSLPHMRPVTLNHGVTGKHPAKPSSMYYRELGHSEIRQSAGFSVQHSQQLETSSFGQLELGPFQSYSNFFVEVNQGYQTRYHHGHHNHYHHHHYHNQNGPYQQHSLAT